MHIGICDDEMNIRAHLRKLVEEQERDCRITEFASGEELLTWAESFDSLPIDILFLDISMKDMDGMTAARRLRTQMRARQEPVWGSLPLLIFVTGYEEYMPDAFSVHAFQYMVKPVKEQDFRKIFGQAVQEYDALLKRKQKRPKELILKNGSAVRKIPTEEICYLEGNNRKVIVCLLHEKAAYYAKLGDLEKELGPSFFRIHRGYLVHMKYVERYDRKQVVMKNQDCLLISRYKYQDFVQAYMNYITGELL